MSLLWSCTKEALFVFILFLRSHVEADTKLHTSKDAIVVAVIRSSRRHAGPIIVSVAEVVITDAC